MWSTYGTDGLPADQINLQQTPLCVGVWVTLSVKQHQPTCQETPQLSTPVSWYLSSSHANNVYFYRRRSKSIWIRFWLLHSYSELLLLDTDTVGSQSFLNWTMRGQTDPRSADLTQSHFIPEDVFGQPKSEWPSTLEGHSSFQLEAVVEYILRTEKENRCGWSCSCETTTHGLYVLQSELEVCICSIHKSGADSL